ncbi:sugar phosphate isomerase/epimerase family protein [Mucisphaera calidilacus]|nr:sugar phosphate isomerase/epimerase family protein [Mucisphaera calidilacus]
MYLTGFADEAAADLPTQIKATQELGWKNIECRKIDGVNLHDLDEAAFDRVCEQLAEADVRINCFGSAIANWACSVNDPFEDTLDCVKRAIPRMQRLNTSMIRIMSYRVEKDRAADDQQEDERFRRLRTITDLFLDAGLQPVHENCMNYGGMGWTYTLRMLDAVPGLKLVFDTGNPCFTPEYRKPEPHPRQSSYDFFRQVRDHVCYIHIKDAVYRPDQPKPIHTMPGEGHGDVRLVLADLVREGYQGGISIEPHLASVHHTDESDANRNAYDTYVAYGRRLMELLADAGADLN